MLQLKHYKLCFSPLSFTVRYYRTEWNDGDDGYAWKNRYLTEKRQLSLKYLNNITQRVPIHDAIRQRMEITHNSINQAASEVAHLFSDKINEYNESSLQRQNEQLLLESLAEKCQNRNEMQSRFNVELKDNTNWLNENNTSSEIKTNTDDILKEISEMECNEGMEDMIKYVNTTDAPLLTEELLEGNTLVEENIAKAINKVRENRIDDYQSYAAVPSKERSLWSAWYLRHVKSNESINED